MSSKAPAPEPCAKAVYLCIDMQHSQVAHNKRLVPIWEALKANVAEDIRLCNAQGIPVIYIAINSTKTPAWEGIGPFHLLPPHIKQRLETGYERFDILPPPAAIVGLKTSNSILRSPPIAAYLKEQGFTTFLLGGVLEAGTKPHSAELRCEGYCVSESARDLRAKGGIVYISQNSTNQIDNSTPLPKRKALNAARGITVETIATILEKLALTPRLPAGSHHPRTFSSNGPAQGE